MVKTQDQDASAYAAFIDRDNPDNAPLYFANYLYNITNPVEVLTAQEIPKVTRIGPYVVSCCLSGIKKVSSNLTAVFSRAVPRHEQKVQCLILSR